MNCQAVPVAARHAWSNHRLCAAEAGTTVPFKGLHVPVCWTHAAMYHRQPNVFAAEAMARKTWGWTFTDLHKALVAA